MWKIALPRSTNSVSGRAVVEGNACQRNSSGLVSMVINYSPGTATTPLRSYTGLRRNYSLKWESPVWYMVGRVAVRTRTCPCSMSWPDPLVLIFRTFTCCFLLLHALTQVTPLGHAWSPTHPQQHPFPKPLPAQFPASIITSLPSSPSILCGFRAHHPLPSANGKISFWGGRVAGRQNFALSMGITFL